MPVPQKYQHTTAELRLVEGGDPSINPGAYALTSVVNIRRYIFRGGEIASLWCD